MYMYVKTISNGRIAPKTETKSKTIHKLCVWLLINIPITDSVCLCFHFCLMLLIEGISLHDPFCSFAQWRLNPQKTLSTLRIVYSYPFSFSSMIGLICLKIVSNLTSYLITYCYRFASFINCNCFTKCVHQCLISKFVGLPVYCVFFGNLKSRKCKKFVHLAQNGRLAELECVEREKSDGKWQQQDRVYGQFKIRLLLQLLLFTVRLTQAKVVVDLSECAYFNQGYSPNLIVKLKLMHTERVKGGWLK